MRAARFLISCAGAWLAACGPAPDPSMYAVSFSPFHFQDHDPLGALTMILPGESVELPSSARADDNGKPVGHIWRGGWGQQTLFPNWGQDGVISDPRWRAPEIFFTPEDGEERTRITLAFDGKQGVVDIENLWAPFSATPLAPVRAGEVVVLELSSGTAILAHPPEDSAFSSGWMTLEQGSERWSLHRELEEAGAPGTYLLAGNRLQFRVPEGARPGPLQGTILVMRKPTVVALEGFREYAGSILKRERIALEVLP